MASDLNDRDTEAFFLKFMAGELQTEEGVGVMANPKFWKFLASSLSKDDCERLMEEWLRHVREKDDTNTEPMHSNGLPPEIATGHEQKMKQYRAEFLALYAVVPEAEGFRFCRRFFSSTDEGEGEAKPKSQGTETQKNEIGLKMKFESGKPEGKRRTVCWEWTQSDSEAEREEAKRQPYKTESWKGS